MIVSLFCQIISMVTTMMVFPCSWLVMMLWVTTITIITGVRQVQVEDVTARQLQAALNTEELIAVFWCKL